MRLALFVSGLLATHSVQAHEAMRADVAPKIDGDPSDAAWVNASWRALDQLMIGDNPSHEDFKGRYKLVWTADHLYLLAEITDDVLIDTHADPLQQYWEDDTLEVFVDEDASGGIHLEDFNAFAYHVALDNQVVDIAPADGAVAPRLFSDHVQSSWRRSSTTGNPVYWELRIAVYDSEYAYGSNDSSRVQLEAGKRMGLMVAYCDADTSEGRQLFIGDVEVEPVNGDRNLAYIDASVFGKVTLVEQQ